VGGISTSRQTNINTLVSVSNTWTKTLTYTDSLGQSRTCLFNINSANVEVTESTAGGCGYLDTPAHPIPTDPTFAYLWRSDALLAGNGYLEVSVVADRDNVSNRSVSTDRPALLPRLWTAVSDFLVPSAEAAPHYIYRAAPAALRRAPSARRAIQYRFPQPGDE